MALRDPYNRTIHNLRVAVTPQCNLNCPFCHAEGESNPEALMTPDQITEIVKVAVNLGIKRIKITGGEPLIRRDIVEIIRKINTLEITDCSMTTNGTRLAPFAKQLVDAGLTRINISLPTLNPSMYNSLVGGKLSNTLQGLEQAIKSRLFPIKLNMLVLRGINETEIEEMIDFAYQKDVILQLIELEPLNTTDSFFKKHYLDLSKIEEDFKQQAVSIKVRSTMQNRRLYTLPAGRVEIIRPIDNSHFCNACSRIRVTSDGKIKPCLMREDNYVDILSAIKSNETAERLKEIFLSAIERRAPFY